MEFSAIMAVFNLLLRLLSSWVLYIDWGDRWGYHAIIRSHYHYIITSGEASSSP